MAAPLALVVLAAATGLLGAEEAGKLVSVALTAILVVVAPPAIGRHLVRFLGGGRRLSFFA